MFKSLIIVLVLASFGFADTISGDTNGDGIVDATDYILLKNNFGRITSRGAIDGDFNNDGIVDFYDASILFYYNDEQKPHFPIACVDWSAPEPSTVCLLFFGGIVILRRKIKFPEKS